MRGPPVKNNVNIADSVKDSSKKRQFSGALRARIISFLNFRRRRGCQFFLDGNLVLGFRGPLVGGPQ